MVKAGDRVCIKSYSEELNGEFGIVSHRDGFYVYIFPDCQPDNTKYPVELYDNEVEKVKNDGRK